MQPDSLPSNHREQEILKELHLAGGSCRVGFLANRLGVSEETVRRNIKTLQAKSQVRKVHGGVLLIEDTRLNEQPFQARMNDNSEAKRVLAARLSEIISDGDSLFLDIATTSAYAAQALRQHRDLYVVTNSLTVANTLACRNNNRVFFAGGELRAHDGGAFGQDAMTFVRRFNVQYAVLSVAAINAQAGFMLQDIQEADIASEVMTRAQRCIVLADSSKFGHRCPITLAAQHNIDTLITDEQPDAGISEMLARNEISLLQATVQKSGKH